MNIGELRTHLANFDDDLPVYVDTENHQELADEVIGQGIRTELGGEFVQVVTIVGDGGNVAWI